MTIIDKARELIALAAILPAEWDDISEEQYVRAKIAHAVALARAVVELAAALEWYAERAKSLSISMNDYNKRVDYALAIFTELSLDAGQRADAALSHVTEEPCT